MVTGRASRVRTLLARTSLAAVIALLVIGLTVDEVFHLELFQRLELASIDYRFLYRGVNPAIHDSGEVVIVEINEESFRSLPQPFPWTREYYAHVVRNLYRAGARVVGIDLIFDAPDSHGHPAGDSVLAQAIRETGVVVLAGKREQDEERYQIRSVHQQLGNIFFGADSALGLVNIRGDADGIYRLYNPYFLVGMAGDTDRPVPTLGFAVLNRVLGLPPLATPVDRGEAFAYAGRTIPKYDPSSFLINFYGPHGTFKHIRFHDVIDDETFTTVEEQQTGSETNTFSDPDYGYLHDGTFKDKIVLIGVTVPEYKDLFPVSISSGRQLGDNQMYGVEIHANVIENVLRNEFLELQGPASEVPVIVALVLVTFLVTAALRGRARGRQVAVEAISLAFVAAEVILVAAVALWLFTHANYVARVVSPMAAILAGYIGSTVYNMVTERKQRLLIKTMFSTYVSPSVVEELLANPEKLTLGGARRELTVLFSDIEGFTSIAQTLEPERLVALLNDYLDAMSAVILRHTGTLDKYEGDAIMAFWGAPVPQSDHALRACRSALSMRDTLAELNREWEALGRPVFRMRIGVNSGEMVVGNMGSAGKFAYTVIGDSVNLASRLEGANKEYRTMIMVSRRTYELVCHEILGRELDVIRVIGRSEPVAVYELIGPRQEAGDPALREFLAAYEEGMERYHAHRWAEAKEAFARALQLRPMDYPTRLHLERAAQFAASPADDASDVVTLKEK
ncbi:MAG TPA: adenylate/guanylate cyclase domain-containing protein [Chloroflexota bacterium]